MRSPALVAVGACGAVAVPMIALAAALGNVGGGSGADSPAPWWLQYPVAAALVGVMVWLIRHYTGVTDRRDSLFLEELKAQRSASAERDREIVGSIREGHDKMTEGLHRVSRSMVANAAHLSALVTVVGAAAEDGKDLRRLAEIASEAAEKVLRSDRGGA